MQYSPTTVILPDSPGGGGGGGGITGETVSSSEDMQLVRGKQNEIKVLFENKDKNLTLKDLTFELKGAISKYTEIFPKELPELRPGEKINLFIKISSPTYIELGRQELVITINGKKGVSNYLETKKIILEIHELSGEEAKILLNESEELIRDLNEINITWKYLDSLLNESIQALEIFDYEKIRDNFNIIKTNSENVLKAFGIIQELEKYIPLANEKGISTPDSSRLLKLSKLSLERHEYATAYLRAKDAQLSYALETKGKIGDIGYYFKKYPGQIISSMFALFIFGFGAYKFSNLKRIKMKLKKFRKEEKLINELIGALQKETFKEKKMSMEEYEISIEQYHKRLSVIIQEIIKLENKRIHALKFTPKTKRLDKEKKRIIDLIKNLQRDYLENKKLETREYGLKLESYNTRLTEIEESLALLEARKMFRKGIKRIFSNKGKGVIKK